MKKTLLMLTAVVVVATTSCTKNAIDPGIPELVVNEDAAAFAEIGSIDIGETGAAEISAYDAMTQKLFVVRNENEGLANQLNRIEVLDFSNPASPRVIANINVATLGGVVNSVSCFGGRVAAAIQATDKTANGKVAVFRTDDYFKVAEVTVGALPDMVTWSPDGRYILTANEGEPNDAYTVDPNGTISIIDALNNYTVTTLDFSAMASKQADLLSKGFRIFGPGKNFLKDIEPEYITVSGDSKTAWVTLQENNGIAKVDLVTKTITDIFPLGFKDYNANGNEIDPTDDNNAYVAGKWKVFGVYMPDAIAVLEQGGTPYLFTANEGDAREYTGFTEIFRVKNNAVRLDPTAFPNATDLKKDGQLGRLNITTTLGDTDGDGDLDALYSFGARSFSVWNGLTGAQVFDSKNELDKVTSAVAGVYDDGRSDDKSVEPEGLAIGTMGSKKVAFVGMERADAVAIYDVTTPTAPKFLQLLKCGDAPEGVLFIPAKESPTRKSLLVVSSENDGIVKVYTPKNI